MASSVPHISEPDSLLEHRLASLRVELDRIDDAVHDLLMRRAELVAQVGALRAKGPVPLRPGREASIIRRLLARNHGALQPSALVRLWRELLASSSAQQQPMAVAVGDERLLATARAHFGALTPVHVADDALDAVRQGSASVAVMPWPGDWWPALLDQRSLHVVGLLPFWASAAVPGAVMLTAAEPDPSGDDRSLLASRDPNFTAAGFEGAALATQPGAVLADVAGFVTADGHRLPPGTVVLGAYAVPIGETV